jgi:ubiquinol-cytochrome c reductase cytochrome b subunit
VKAITDEVALGSVVRGIHHWGATLIVIVTGLHLLRVFFWGSYKMPRELTWLVGVGLLQVILGFSFTGYLLPWDQKAYWATVVGTRIAGTVPIVGDYVLHLMRGGAEVGALTLTRFYAMHIMVLPAVLVGLAGLHLFLVRKHHIAGPVVPQKGEPVPFWPVQLAKDAAVVVVGIGLLMTLAVAAKPGLGDVADPSRVDFSPRPEWYFLGLFELLKLIPPHLEVIGTLVIPGIGVTVLALLPWLDRSKSRHPAQRRVVIEIAVVAILAIGLLTLKGILEEPPPHPKKAPHATQQASVSSKPPADTPPGRSSR